MKGCLKQCSRPPSPAHDQHSAKHVAFCADGSDQVFFADEWDRTPTEPARHLSYQDILELKEIQRSLPRAIQPADLIGSKPAAHYLSTVPIGLLPLLPESDNTPRQPSSPVASTLTFSQNSWRTVRTPAPSIPIPQSSTWHPPSLSHLPPARPPINRPKGRFAFLPLLDSEDNSFPGSRSRTPSPPASPPPSERSASPDFLDVSHDPPTPALSNASVGSSPPSRASSCSPEPTFLQLPPSCGHGRFCGGFDKKKSTTPATLPEDRLGSSESWIRDPHDYRRPGFGASRTEVTPPSAAATTVIPPAPSTPTKTKLKKEKKKNVIVINDIEIELDDDQVRDDGDDDPEEEINSTPPAKKSSAPSIPTISSPTPTRPFTPPSPSRSPTTFASHTPIHFKRNATTTGVSSCSPPRNSAAGKTNRVLVPSA